MMETKPMPCGNGFAVSRNLNPNLVRVETLKPLGQETRKHPPAQIRKLQASIEQFGFVLPIVIDATSRVIAGWGLALAAKKLGLPEVSAGRPNEQEGPAALASALPASIWQNGSTERHGACSGGGVAEMRWRWTLK